MNFHHARLKALAERLTAESYDSLLVTRPLHLSYLLGYAAPGGRLVVTPRGSTLVLGDPAGWPDDRPALTEVVTAEGDDAATAKLAKVLARAGVRTLGVEADHLTLRQANDLAGRLGGVEHRPAAGLVEAVRAVKDPGEVEDVRRAADAVARTWLMTRVMLAAADTEDDLEAAVAGYARRAGGRLVVPRPVRLGLNTGDATPADDPLTLGVVSKLTFDATVAGRYHSRLVRSQASPFPPAPDRRTRSERVGRKFEPLYAAAVAAQTAAVARLGDGVPVAEVYGAAHEAAARAGCGDGLSPRLGHGVGLEAVEGPDLVADSPAVLRAGMVVHVAPLIAYPGWGGVSVGDDFVVRPGAAVRLSRADPEAGPS